MRSSRRRGPLEHVLIAGDLAETDSIRALLSLMPAATYGQVYVETDGRPLPDLGAPARVTVTALPRRAEDVPGDRLATALEGWVAEWLPEDPEPDRSVTMWVGATASGRISTSALCLERL